MSSGPRTPSRTCPSPPRRGLRVQQAPGTSPCLFLNSASATVLFLCPFGLGKHSPRSFSSELKESSGAGFFPGVRLELQVCWLPRLLLLRATRLRTEQGLVGRPRGPPACRPSRGTAAHPHSLAFNRRPSLILSLLPALPPFPVLSSL